MTAHITRLRGQNCAVLLSIPDLDCFCMPNRAADRIRGPPKLCTARLRAAADSYSFLFSSIWSNLVPCNRRSVVGVFIRFCGSLEPKKHWVVVLKRNENGNGSSALMFQTIPRIAEMWIRLCVLYVPVNTWRQMAMKKFLEIGTS